MTHLALGTAAAITFAAPVLAQTQLERLLGVNPHIYAPSELVELHFAEGAHDTPPVRFVTEGALVISTREPHGKPVVSSIGASGQTGRIDHQPAHPRVGEGPTQSP